MSTPATPFVLNGLNGANPLGFMASLGLLVVASQQHVTARLAFTTDGTFAPCISGVDGDLAELVAADAASQAGPQPWRLEYSKEEKRGSKTVADLKPPPEVFRRFADDCIQAWLAGHRRAAAYAAAFGTSIARDGKGNTKPTALHFTAAQQQFLQTVECSRTAVTREWAHRTLWMGGATEPGSNLRWDPAAERSWALMAANPNVDGTVVDAPAEWLAFRGLELLPCFPIGTRVQTTGVRGRGQSATMVWPLWAQLATVSSVRSLLQSFSSANLETEKLRGVFASCTSEIRRTSQGFGNFGPAAVTG